MYVLLILIDCTSTYFLVGDAKIFDMIVFYL
jgi:hypothetical protein